MSTSRTAPDGLTLGSTPSLPQAFERLSEALSTLDAPVLSANGGAVAVQLTRLEVEVEAEIEPLHWISHQRIFPRVYFSNVRVRAHFKQPLPV